LNEGALVFKTGVTQELRARVAAHMAAEAGQRRRLTASVGVIAILAVALYLLLRWLR
jgi:hypothetical protein